MVPKKIPLRLEGCGKIRGQVSGVSALFCYYFLGKMQTNKLALLEANF